VAKAAYDVGAKYVEVIWADEEMLRLRAQHAPRDSFDEYPTFMIDAVMNMINHGDALLSISGSNPDLLGGLDPEVVGMMQTRHLNAASKVSERITTNAINWCVVAAAGEEWAKKIFPDLSVSKAQEKLWKAIFETTRIDQPDPIEAWNKHIGFCKNASIYANNSPALQSPRHRTCPGCPGHRWLSAQ
jgi:aminopeptidase